MGAGELMLVLVVALLLFGSKNLPKIARTLGKTMEDLRRAARNVSEEILRAGDSRPTSPKSETPAQPKKDSSNEKLG
jgi:sec-independent protein translocase protein TatA